MLLLLLLSLLLLLIFMFFFLFAVHCLTFPFSNIKHIWLYFCVMKVHLLIEPDLSNVLRGYWLALYTVDFEMWHLELITGLVVLISSSRYFLLKVWPDFAKSSEAANQQVCSMWFVVFIRWSQIWIMGIQLPVSQHLGHKYLFLNMLLTFGLVATDVWFYSFIIIVIKALSDLVVCEFCCFTHPFLLFIYFLKYLQCNIHICCIKQNIEYIFKNCHKKKT